MTQATRREIYGRDALFNIQGESILLWTSTIYIYFWYQCGDFFFRFIVLHKLKVVNSERKKKATKIETKKQEQQQQMHPTIAIALPMAKYMTIF